MDLIDDTGFELGMPTLVEMLKHQCHLLCNENDQLHRELAQAQRNIEKLVEINQSLQAQVSAQSTRANLAHVRNVMIMNRLRTEHGIDIGTW